MGKKFIHYISVKCRIMCIMANLSFIFNGLCAFINLTLFVKKLQDAS